MYTETKNIQQTRLLELNRIQANAILILEYHKTCIELLLILLSFQEPTRIDLIPKRTELTVGESIVLSCKAIHDNTLDVTFYWTLNGQPIDFEKEGGHFESIRAVSEQYFIFCKVLTVQSVYS